MLLAKIEKLLNAQIVIEGFSSHYYLAMASWCEKSKLTETAKFFYKHAEEERMHMLKIIRYVNEENGHAIVPAIKQPPPEYKSIEEILGTALQHEKEVTKSIHHILDNTLDAKDFRTAQFLQWYVAEQQEEEQLFQLIADKYELIGVKDKRGLYLFDKFMSKVEKTES